VGGIEFIKRAGKIKMLILDVDGVLTGGEIIYGNDSFEMKKFNVQDGMGISMAKKSGILLGIITGRESLSVQRRAEELGFDEIYQNSPIKIKAYKEIIKKRNLKNEEIIYVGDDLQDIPVLKRVGISCSVANGVGEVKELVDYVATKKGGDGGVREIIDWFLDLRGEKQKILDSYYNG
jgi:3-deoxy-D-manno-octulosonate 8-phosphate phosphatase (KDO 8-P phosphatase)